MNFKSQICTTREQSERLLSLGLKKETADMVLCEPFDYEKYKYSDGCVKIVLEEEEGFCKKDIPAWSLHRIISMVYSSRAKKNGLGLAIIEYENPFEDMIRQIEWLIKEGYFNKEYLKHVGEETD